MILEAIGLWRQWITIFLCVCVSVCDYSNLMTYDRLYKLMKRRCFLYHSIYLIDSHGIVVVVQSPNHVLLSVTHELKHAILPCLSLTL